MQQPVDVPGLGPAADHLPGRIEPQRRANDSADILLGYVADFEMPPSAGLMRRSHNRVFSAAVRGLFSTAMTSLA